MHIRATVFPIPPYAYAPSVENPFYTGPIPKMFQNIAERMNFNGSISMPADSVSLKLDNGSWTSFRGMIQRNETDMALGPEILVPEQLEGVKIGTYYFLYTFFFFASAGDPKGADFSNIVMAFDREIWYILVSLVFALALSTSIFDFTNDYFLGTKSATKLSVIEMNFWMYLATFLLEGTPRMPTHQKSRFVFGIWLMAVLVMMNAFSCQFKTALMIKGPDDTMYTVKDLSERPELTIYSRKSGYLEKLFEESPVDVYQQIWKNILGKEKDGFQEISYFFERELYDNIKAGKGVIMTPQEFLKAVIQHFCPTMVGNRRFYFVKEPAFSNTFAFYVTPTFPDDLLREFNKRVRWIDEGMLFSTWMASHYKEYSRKCLTTESVQSENQDTQGLTFHHILPAVFVTMTLQSFALLVLLLEILFHSLKSG